LTAINYVGKCGLADCSLYSQSPIILLLSILIEQAKSLHTLFFLSRPPTYIKCHSKGFWGRSYYRLGTLHVTQPAVSKHCGHSFENCYVRCKTI